jgi:hypothetical protein
LGVLTSDNQNESQKIFHLASVQVISIALLGESYAGCRTVVTRMTAAPHNLMMYWLFGLSWESCPCFGCGEQPSYRNAVMVEIMYVRDLQGTCDTGQAARPRQHPTVQCSWCINGNPPRDGDVQAHHTTHGSVVGMGPPCAHGLNSRVSSLAGWKSDVPTSFQAASWDILSVNIDSGRGR